MLLSVIIPTYNERENIAQLLSVLTECLHEISGDYEIVVVDDSSTDGTGEIVAQCGYSSVSLLPRCGKRDLSLSLFDGFNAAAGRYVVAMDADGQHDPRLVPVLLNTATATSADLVIASRYGVGGSIEGWNWFRRGVSLLATWLVQGRIKQPISDPLSGFFLLSRTVWRDLHWQQPPAGFKLLLDILFLKPEVRWQECGYRFSARLHGVSKFNVSVCLAFMKALWRKQC